MIPVKQRCPKCGEEFEGSDALGEPCPRCQGFSLLGQSITRGLEDAIKWSEGFADCRHDWQDRETKNGLRFRKCRLCRAVQAAAGAKDG